MTDKFSSFSDFYPYYLQEHSKNWTKILHFIGTLLSICCIFLFLFNQGSTYLLMAPIFGYGFAWVGHYFIEKNRPATFQYPLYSLLGDFVMFWQILVGKIKVV